MSGSIAITRSASLACAVWLCVPTSLVAQEPSRMYVFAGIEAVPRQPGTHDFDRDRSIVPAVTAGAGVWIQPRLGIEGSLSLQRGQTIPWRYSYLFAPNSLQQTNDRDMPLVGSLRYAAAAGHRVGADFVVGAGLTRHSARSLTVADCGSGQFTHPCVPLAEPVISDTWSSWERLLSVGFEVPVHVGRGATIAPAVHMVTIHRRPYLTGYDHRGPIPGNGFIASFGAMVSWRDR